MDISLVKPYVLSPFTKPSHAGLLLHHLLEVRRREALCCHRRSRRRSHQFLHNLRQCISFASKDVVRRRNATAEYQKKLLQRPQQTSNPWQRPATFYLRRAVRQLNQICSGQRRWC
nr:hypothetical protein Itr_chr10CG13950 [Ipomoea trifida]